MKPGNPPIRALIGPPPGPVTPAAPQKGRDIVGGGGTRVETDADVMKATRIEKVYRIRAAHYPIWFMTVIMITICGAIYTITAWATSVALR